MTNEKAMEVVDTEAEELETTPEASGLVNVDKDHINSIIELADNADKLIAAYNKIRMAILKLAQPEDWIVFTSPNGSKKATLGHAGTTRIASIFGVNFTNWEIKKEIGHDENGDWYRWEVECDASYHSRSIRVYGRAGSRDKFFGKEKGSLKELKDIDEGNIKMVARRAAMKEGVKVLFGLHGMDPEFLKQNGVRVSEVQGYTFKSNAPQSGGNGNGSSQKISEAQGKRLFALLKTDGKTPDELKAYLKEVYHIEHSSEIERKDYESICNWAQAPKGEF